MSWREIYKCQLACDSSDWYERRKQPLTDPLPNASDFVLSFTLSAPVTGQVVVDQTHRLPATAAGGVLASAKLWESPPAWLAEGWDGDEGGLNTAAWEDGESPSLSVWISRAMKTAACRMTNFAGSPCGPPVALGSP